MVLFRDVSVNQVNPGDDLSRIVLAVYGDGYDANGQKIFEANKAVIGNDPSCLRPGQILNIP